MTPTDLDKEAFKAKLRSLSFGRVPGGSKPPATGLLAEGYSEKNWIDEMAGEDRRYKAPKIVADEAHFGAEAFAHERGITVEDAHDHNH